MSQVIPLHELPVLDKNENIQPPIEFSSGVVILMDKPTEWSSFDVVRYVRNRVGVRKTGHAGTLDPLACGLLILCCGRATKSISQIQVLPKTYAASITFGMSTPSYDAALEPDAFAETNHISEDLVRQAMKDEFTGTILQKPPAYSAIRKQGKRLYELARRGEEVNTEARPVEIYDWKIVSYSEPVLEMEIRCGKGTYIRSLAHDLGLALGSRATLSGLRRTKTGPYNVEDAFTPVEFDHYIKELNG